MLIAGLFLSHKKAPSTWGGVASRSGLLSGAGRSGELNHLRVSQGVQMVGPFLYQEPNKTPQAFDGGLLRK